MLQIMLVISMILVSFMFFQMHHPLSMGLTLLGQTLIISMFIGLMNESFWFSYILFLVFLGGMLILFIYVTSVASNEKFSMSINWMMISIIPMFMIFNIDPQLITFMSSTSMESEIITKMFNFPSNFITIILMSYLLLTLIAVVKITNIFYGPLRQMYN